MRHLTRVATGVLLLGVLLAAGCGGGTTAGAVKGPATGKPTVYEFSTET